MELLKQIPQEGTHLSQDDLRAFIEEAFSREDFDSKRLLFIIPDATRSMPHHAMFRGIVESLRGRAKCTDFLIALGTHPPMKDAAIDTMLGLAPGQRANEFGDVQIFNHAWKDPGALTTIGTISADEVDDISGGLMKSSVPVTVNKKVLEYDLVCIVGPVFPHEVAGFSGGTKYFFPGVAGQEVIDLFHWLGALITNPIINGTKYTPVRAVIDKSASFIPTEKRAFCLDVLGDNCHGIFYGDVDEAWSACADRASESHITWCDKPFDSVLAMAPPMYDEIWVAGKCMYKLEPVVADGGELIIYGPHIHEISITHGTIIKEIGYHTRDYFLAQWEKFKDYPGGILAHSTHVRGIGAYEDGVEK